MITCLSQFLIKSCFTKDCNGSRFTLRSVYDKLEIIKNFESIFLTKNSDPLNKSVSLISFEGVWKVCFTTKKKKIRNCFSTFLEKGINAYHLMKISFTKPNSLKTTKFLQCTASHRRIRNPKYSSQSKGVRPRKNHIFLRSKRYIYYCLIPQERGIFFEREKFNSSKLY